MRVNLPFHTISSGTRSSLIGWVVPATVTMKSPWIHQRVTFYPFSNVSILKKVHWIWVCLKMLCTPKPNGFADHYPYSMAISLGMLTQHFQVQTHLFPLSISISSTRRCSQRLRFCEHHGMPWPLKSPKNRNTTLKSPFIMVKSPFIVAKSPCILEHQHV